MSAQPGDRVGRFEIRSSLGEGGMGQVYRAHDPLLGREVAIKVIHIELDEKTSIHQRFAQEARAASALNHPNIVTIHDVGQENGRPYIVMEFLEGRTLRHMLADPIPAPLALELAVQIADALACAHERHIVHRDLKPENIFVTNQNVVKILDFGLARICEINESRDAGDSTVRRLTAENIFLGTPGYAAPEAFASAAGVDLRADIFSFGAILYELASGLPAFRRGSLAETMAATLRDDPRPLPQRSDLPPRLAEIISRCLHKNPEKRFSSVRDVHRELVNLPLTTPAMTLTPGRPKKPLPAPRTSLIGRELEVEKITTLVTDGAARLVTLIGPGGCGKTRLALAVAAKLDLLFKGHVIFIPLGPVRDAENVLPMIADALNAAAPGAGESALDPIVAELNQTAAPTLFVLDNFEHVMAAANDLSDLLAASPYPSFIVTSREVLRLYGEHDVPVTPLKLPPPDEELSLEELARTPAVALFIERARAADHNFQLNRDTVRAVVEICRRLDGLPLALELAAARIRTLAPQALVARLGQRLQLLTAGARDLPDRQHTMRKAIDWSFELLSPEEQTLLRRLSTFAGAFTLEGAEAVYDPFGKLGVETVDAVASLVDKSLLQKVGDEIGETRFLMLETIREYASDLLSHSADRESTLGAHAAYFLVLAEEGATMLAAGESPEWLDLFSREHENFRAALDWLLASGNAEWGLRLSLGLFHFWERKEHLAEGRERLSGFLDLSDGGTDDGLRARALFALGVLASAQYDSDEAIRRTLQSLSIHEKRGDDRGMAVAHNSIGINFTDRGEFEQAAHHLAESLEAWRAAGDEGGYARSLSNLAFVRRKQRRHDESISLYDEASAIFTKLGDDVSSAWSLHHRGGVAGDQNLWSDATGFHQQALASFRKLGDPWGAASTLAELGTMARGAGNLEEAAAYYREALELFHQLGHRRGIARMFESILTLVAKQGAHECALTLASAAAALRKRLGVPGPITDQAELLARVDEACINLQPEVVERAQRLGKSLTLSKAVRFAKSALDSGVIRRVE